MAQAFTETYNDLSASSCDAAFRTISDTTISIVSGITPKQFQYALAYTINATYCPVCVDYVQHSLFSTTVQGGRNLGRLQKRVFLPTGLSLRVLIHEPRDVFLV